MQKLRRSSPHPLPELAERSVEAPLAADVTVAILVISLRDGAPTTRTSALVHGLTAAFDDVRSTARVVLLPGWTRGWPVADQVVADACRKHGAAVLFERAEPGGTGTWAAYDAGGHSRGVAIRQMFTDSGQADREPEQVRALLDACAPGGERIVRLSGLDVGLLCCGENNVLRCEQAFNNRVSVRHHPGASLFEHVSVTFNGAHSNMGNWNKLNRRFEYLSRGGRLALYATNNSAASWRGSVRAYHDGHLVADGGGVLGAPAGIQVGLVADDARDRFRAIIVTARGGLLRSR